MVNEQRRRPRGVGTACSSRMERKMNELEWWRKEKERAIERGTLDEVATADKNIRILTKKEVNR